MPDDVSLFLAALGNAEHAKNGALAAESAEVFAGLTPAASTFGQRLRARRVAHGWSMSELSRRAKVSTSTVMRSERGLVFPRIDRLERMAAAFGVSIEDLTAKEAT